MWKNRLFRSLLVSLIACCGLLPAMALAQPGNAPPERRGDGRRGGNLVERIEQAMQDLDLSDEQKAQVEAILEKSREEMRAAMQEMQGLEPQARRQRMREMMMDVNEQLTGVLNEDQKAAFQRKLAEMRAQAGRDGRGAEPGTQPAAGRVGAIIEQLRDAIEQLNLTDEQKSKAEQILQDTRTKLRVLRDEAAGDIEKIRDKAREIINDTRQDLQEVLTPQQQEKLRELMEAARGARGQRGDNPRGSDRPNRPEPPDRGSAPPPMDDQNRDKPATRPGDGPRSALPPPGGLPPGQAAPDFALAKLDGRTVQLSSFKGRVLVLLFGNYSSPAFRERVGDFEQLRKQYANRAEFLLVYTREAHAVGEWEVERNRDAKIAVEQPATLDARKALAQQARQALKITMPIALDTMDNKTASDYAGFTAAAVVVGRDGKVVAHRKWAETDSLRRIIDEAMSTRPSTRPADS